MTRDHPTLRDGTEVGDVTTRRCETCGAAMAFIYGRNDGYYLSCVVSPAMDHRVMLTPDDLAG